MFERTKRWLRAAERDVVALGLAARDPRVPWYAKALALFIAAYALSPIDLIPDFIPVFGLLDDVIVVGLGLWLVVRMIPPSVMDEHRASAEQRRDEIRFVARIGAAIIVAQWIALVALAGWLAFNLLGD